MAPSPDPTSAPSDALERELRRRRRHIATLEARRADLLREIASLERELVSWGPAPPRLSSPDLPSLDRLSLPDALEKVLAEGQMNVAVLTEEVLRRGYRTTTDWFRRVGNKPLLSDARFVAVSRGVYALRGAPKQR